MLSFASQCMVWEVGEGRDEVMTGGGFLGWAEGRIIGRRTRCEWQGSDLAFISDPSLASWVAGSYLWLLLSVQI